MRSRALLLSIVLGLLTTQARGAGPYDGIWIASYLGNQIGYYSVHENNGMLVAISLRGDNTLWEAYLGQRIFNVVTVSTIVSGVNATFGVQFISDSNFTATQLSCVPRLAGWNCPFADGAVIQGVKIW